ncbi:hypothetical protein [Pseudodesulfovibrio tunisiensis]|uniref:hypothetical protein n=1 Tax=Pseudodesulfovibrio tunisiensis TaxID=463192 RepID=UPI001FB5148C|nr:hypothetical protein [Pseudodesulfovibrio tunisiensis]
MEGTPQLYDFVNPANPGCVLEEVHVLARAFHPSLPLDVFDNAFRDVERLFHGEYPGYRASNTKYHDFEHTCSVVLAGSRLLHGAQVDGEVLSGSEVLTGLLALLFHDVGLIQTEDDTSGTGAKYTVGHEERSILFMRTCLRDHADRDFLEDVAKCIRCTILMVSPKSFDFRTPGLRLAGWITGTADLVAQIADRLYLEKLLLLFEEFQEAGLPGYKSPVDLLLKTRSFYEDVALKRMVMELGDARRYMLPHFRKRWHLDRDLYAHAIKRNLDYLQSILDGCPEDLECFVRNLRRGSACTMRENDRD